MRNAILIFLLIPFSILGQENLHPKVEATPERKILILPKKIKPLDTITWNELRFKKPHGALITGAFLFHKFKDWDEVIKQPKPATEMLVWNNVKLLSESDELFTVFAFGEESISDYYTSVIVKDSNGKDCLRDESEFKGKIIEYFSAAIAKEINSYTFYKKLWKMRGGKMPPRN